MSLNGDGHGSTRQLADSTGAIVSGQEYSYDGYGVMLSDGSGADAVANAGTKMLYAGEQYDANASMYYNRARYYNPANGTFNRVDPYSGNTQDPQSLHKYAYCHANPINAIDPTGMMSLSSTMVTMGIMASLTSIYNMAVLGYTAHSVGENGLKMSGIIVNLFGGYSSHGFGGSASLSLYFDFATNRPYLFVSGEAGLIPLSFFKTQRGFDRGFGIGAVFNAESPGDLSGGSSTATWPFAMMRWVAPGPLKASSHWAIMMNLAKAVKNTSRAGQRSIQIQKSWTSKAFEFSFLRGTYSFAGTASWASKPIDIFEGMNDLSEETRRAVSRIQGTLSGIRESLDNPGEIKQYVDRIQQIIDQM